MLSELPWAIHYAAGSAPWLAHLGFGLLPPTATESLAVHPYPLYESVGLLVWIPIALHLVRRLRSEGALLAFTAAWDLALRGFIDGTRAMINVWWGLLGSQRIYPAAHLRAGASFLSLDASMFDRQDFLGYPSYRLGVSGAFGPEGRIRHPNDTRVRYFVGVVTFPGTDFSTGLAHAMLGSGLELYLSRRLVLGLGMAVGDGLVGNVHLRSRVGD